MATGPKRSIQGKNFRRALLPLATFLQKPAIGRKWRQFGIDHAAKSDYFRAIRSFRYVPA